ncbi:hypothetical protein [Chryseobacterium sp. W4I1]|uniref:hypothetical protein n=1 Tax=Chryseobacterium sp. W4I1 TaxID=3042293 RepID=UPI00278AB8C1|nr:hypothetical protein [Chryseobacterium sp. W4I1]MDQ0781357.1 hypothetical protein [Chryseobacterium sp. W4I1]
MSSIIVLQKETSGCPMIWEGTIDNKPMYIRYRWGVLSLNINNVAILHVRLDQYLDGVLSINDAIDNLTTQGYQVINEIE